MTVPSGPDVAGLPFGWGAIFALLNLLLGGGAIAGWIRTRPKMRELEQSAEKNLRDDLIARVDRLERRLEVEQAERQAERARHEAEIGVMRHRVNNSDQCLDMLLMLLETAPDRVAEAVARIKDMRARQRERETVEQATIRAATIQATAAQAPAA